MAQDADTDELSTFVSGTLKAIAAGIAEAQSVLISSAHGTGVSGFTAPKDVEFDIAVSAKSTGGASGGLKISVFGIGANTGAQIGAENSTISRIRFSIPTRLKINKEDATPIPTSTTWNKK